MTKKEYADKETTGDQQQQRLPLFKGQTSEAKESEKQGYGDEEDGPHQKGARQMRWFYDNVFRGKAAMWTAIFTCVLAVFSYLLYQVSTVANQTTVSTQRAFITFGGMQGTNAINLGKLQGANMTVTWGNSGETPTKIAEMQFNASVGDKVPDLGLNFDDLPQNEKIPYEFGPKQATQMPTVFVSNSDLESMAAGKTHIFIWGWVVYKDIFSGTPQRLSEFCLKITNPRWTKDDHTDPTGAIFWDNPPCPVHNCYDEACSDYAARTK